MKKRPCAVVQGRLYVAGEIPPLAPMAQGGYLPKSSKAPFGRHALRSAPRLPAKGGQFDAHSARSVFSPRTWPRPPSLVLRTIHLAPRRKTAFIFSRHGRETLRGFSFGNKTPCACGTRGFVYNLVESFAILSGSFGLLTTLHTGAFVMLTLTDLCQNTGLNAATLKAFQSAIQRFIFSYTDFSHLFSLPSNMPRESVTRA